MRLRNDERGVSAVEFALVLPVLVMLTVGMFHAGIALHRQLSLDHAARDGARHGATLAIVDDDLDGFLGDVAARTKQAAAGELDDPGDDGRFICVAYLENGLVRSVVEGIGPDGLPAEGFHDVPCFDDDRPTTESRVQVWIGRDTFLDAVFLRTTVSLDTTALARYERQW